jgi:hypothetical protein
VRVTQCLGPYLVIRRQPNMEIICENVRVLPSNCYELHVWAKIPCEPSRWIKNSMGYSGILVWVISLSGMVYERVDCNQL